MRAAIGALFVMVAMSGGAAAGGHVWIWRYDGSRQCAMAAARPLADGQRILEAAGAKVLAARRRAVPLRVLRLCGAPTGAASSYQISTADWANIKAKSPRALGFSLWKWSLD